ncbi:hypothetical protein [Paenibacillus graminis]|uniref:hypothetical protein n=1 Tax=Paenibacillus graminis TaxID=189425 RepID=UPI002DC00F72|nr:hypothetical protein [Paenibacillus graminis]MEC0168822.1 hypothetical protein [Paenibacillus graminis]
MMRIFKYDLYRMLWNKFFVGLGIITVLYSYQLMAGEIVLGIANTAPYSGWSYGMFLAKMLPVLLLSLLFFISFLYSGKEQRVREIINSAPFDPRRLGLLRCGAMIIGFLCITLISIIVSMWFYAIYFKFADLSQLLLPILITILPAMLFILGLGIAAGRIHRSLLYALMFLILLFSLIPLPYAFDLFGTTIYQAIPPTLPLGVDGEPAFVIPASVWIGKVVYSLIGIILLILGLTRRRTTQLSLTVSEQKDKDSEKQQGIF